MENVNQSRPCVLVADDVEFSRGILKMLLRHDYEVLEASNGDEAVSQLKENAQKISCILLDIKMPGLDGYGVMDFMRQEKLIKRIPVIALTSLSDPQGHIRCYESGAIDLIEKPFNQDLLLYKVNWIIQRFRRLSDVPVQSSTPISDSVSPLDAVRRHCAEVFGLTDETELAAMMGSFMRTFAGCIERLRAQERAPDFGVVRDVTHDLRGFAENSGAFDLADLNLVLNTCAKATNAEATSAAIRRIIACYESYCR